MDVVIRPEEEEKDEEDEMEINNILQGEEPDDSKLLGPIQAAITALRSMELGTTYAKQCVFYIDHVLVCLCVRVCLHLCVCVSLLFPCLGFAYSRLIIFPPRSLSSIYPNSSPHPHSP
jgi:hypothetical protein